MKTLTTRKENKMTLNGNLLTGDTFPVKSHLKNYCDGKWNKDEKGWNVNVEKLNALISNGNSIGLRYTN